MYADRAAQIWFMPLNLDGPAVEWQPASRSAVGQEAKTSLRHAAAVLRLLEVVAGDPQSGAGCHHEVGAEPAVLAVEALRTRRVEVQVAGRRVKSLHARCAISASALTVTVGR